MRAETNREDLWAHLVRPIFGPVLLAQGALVAFCLLVGLVLWWSLPAQASWSMTAGLMLALLVGSCLNGMIFLTLLHQRLERREEALEQCLAEGEDWLETTARQEGATLSESMPDEDPKDRILRLFHDMRLLCEVMSQRADRLAHKRDGDHAQLLAVLQSKERSLDQLLLGRRRAREESQLKSGYLGHLRQELEPLMASLDDVIELSSSCDVCPASAPAGLERLRERLSEMTVLVNALAGGAAEEGAVVWNRPASALIVDDGPVNLLLARQVLESQGFVVETATTGAEALAWQVRVSFNLVLMDIFMPDMDGVETSRRWREQEGASGDRRRSVLVALTANVSDDDRRRFREAGIDDYLIKPYRPQVLTERIWRWLPDRTAATVRS